MPTLYRPTAILSLRHAPSWLLLAFAAGAVNVTTFLACERFVTHLTGTATRIGLDAPRWAQAADYALVVALFVLGAMTSVIAIDGRFQRGRTPLYALPLVLVAVLVAGVGVAGHAGAFGAFGGATEQPADLVLLCLLGFAMGLQNAAVTTSTGAIVRTTHLTGPATDLGIHLARSFYTAGEERWTALRHAALRGGKILSFVMGAAVCAPLAQRHGFLAFVLPAVVVLVATVLSFVPASAELPQATLPRASTA